MLMIDLTTVLAVYHVLMAESCRNTAKLVQLHSFEVSLCVQLDLKMRTHKACLKEVSLLTTFGAKRLSRKCAHAATVTKMVPGSCLCYSYDYT